MTAPPPDDRKSADWTSAYHAPVLATAVVELLGGRDLVLDGTLGGGGHALALLESDTKRVVGLDRDPEAIAEARYRLREMESAGRFRALQGSFANIDDIPELSGFRFDGVLLDLGISSHQIDDETRGFTFRERAPLDMRMAGREASGESTAAELLNALDVGALTAIFREYGDEPRAARLAREIVRRRANQPFAISDHLVGAIRGALGPRTGPSDFARLFQAVRVAVNDELEGLARALPLLRDRLEPGGILAVIAYHSGEDRLVKHAFRAWASDCVCPPKQPVCTCRGTSLGQLAVRKAIVASTDEVALNPRARSARLRAFLYSPGT